MDTQGLNHFNRQKKSGGQEEINNHPIFPRTTQGQREVLQLKIFKERRGYSSNDLLSLYP